LDHIFVELNTIRLIMKYIRIVFLVALFFIACHSLKKSQTANHSEDFNQFYFQFHADSIYQLERIKFPLEGRRYDNDEEIRWSRKNWQQLKYTVYEVDTNQYIVEFDVSDTLVFERIYIPNSGFDFQCKYKLIDGKWFLVYCLDQNL